MSAEPLDILTRLLGRLPSIGEKSAQRLAMHLVGEHQDYLDALGTAIMGAGRSTRECSVCCDLTNVETCTICSDARRDQTAILVVARPSERIVIERAAVWQGRYHVLHGVLDPVGGVGPSELRIRELLRRLGSESGVTEVIIATSPTVEGDITALYLAGVLNPIGIMVSRIASGLAVGGEIEHADMGSLGRALGDRRTIERNEP